MSKDFEQTGNSACQWTDVKGIAQHTGMSTDFFNRDRCTKLVGVPYSRLGRKILYNIREVDKFIADRMVRTEEVR